jgi:hypothetical protein
MDILPVIQQDVMINNKDEIISFGDIITFYVSRRKLVSNDGKSNNIINISNNKYLELVQNTSFIGDLQLYPGNEIHVFCHLKRRSDAPLRCFRYTFPSSSNDKDESKNFNSGKQGVNNDANADECSTTDYFKCIDCGCNWICKNCATSCHIGHKLELFMKSHKPTYACCFCFKKKNVCKLKE